MSQALRRVERHSMLLLIVRYGDSDMYRYLRQTFAGQPVWITWDRRVRERRHTGRHIAEDRRQRDRRNDSSQLSLDRLPFVALTLPVRSYWLAS